MRLSLALLAGASAGRLGVLRLVMFFPLILRPVDAFAIRYIAGDDKFLRWQALEGIVILLPLAIIIYRLWTSFSLLRR